MQIPVIQAKSFHLHIHFSWMYVWVMILCANNLDLIGWLFLLHALLLLHTPKEGRLFQWWSMLQFCVSVVCFSESSLAQYSSQISLHTLQCCLRQWFSNWRVTTPQPDCPGLCSFKGRAAMWSLRGRCRWSYSLTSLTSWWGLGKSR